jgi:hypothetical protein
MSGRRSTRWTPEPRPHQAYSDELTDVIGAIRGQRGPRVDGNGPPDDRDGGGRRTVDPIQHSGEATLT